MKRNINILLQLTGVSLIAIFFTLKPVNAYAQQFGNFPYEESCLNGKPAAISYAAPQNITNSATFVQGKGLQLTSNQQTSFGGVFIYDRQFGCTNGIIIEFEFMMYGGTGGDGISMFLFDASVSQPKMGAPGAGIGYTYNQVFKSQYLTGRYEGLTGAYLGVALDEYGNYKALRWYRNEMRGGISYATPPPNRFNLDDQKPVGDDTGDQVTIRGARGKGIGKEITFRYQQTTGSSDPGMGPETGKAQIFGDGFSGYPVLITRSTKQGHGYILADDGRHVSSNYSGNKFSLTQGSGSSNLEYRKAIIELFPVESGKAGGGFYVTVKIQHGNQTDVIIDDYQYKESFTYRETPEPFSYNAESPNDPNPYTLDAEIPDFLRIGFAAATGKSTNTHIIKHIKVSLPRAAEAYMDSIGINPSQMTGTISPYDNDVAYNGVISRTQTGKKQNIDPTQFRFIVNGVPKPVPSGQTFVEATVDQVKWRYDVNTQLVTFQRLDSSTGVKRIPYDIKGKKDNTPQAGPYEDEAYRSLKADLVIKTDDQVEPTVKRVLITNKMVTSRPFKK
ncbi:hypothetical protein [Prevotella sp. 10(H)]|uniref:hypothetical protein n=1 Tax=Prevotella sp. 10(H) TaxID=1158294 RepID=UPI0004A6E883|nr:hypothetical protein [Prevotella sp. 10(H)]